MAGSGKIIHALRRKLEIIAEGCRLTRKLKRESLRDLASKAGFSYDTLKSTWNDSYLKDDIEAKIAAFVGFSTESRRWHDPLVEAADRDVDPSEYMGADSIDAFRRYLFVEILHIDDGANLKLEPSAPAIRNRDIATCVVDSTRQLASYGQPHVLFLIVAMKPGYYGETVFGFNRVRVRFKRPPNQALRFDKLAGEIEPLTIRDAALSVEGGAFDPEWFLASTSMLSGEYRSQGPFCEVSSGRAGDEIKVEFSAQKGDSSLVDQTGAPIQHPEKAAIVKLLASLKLDEAEDANGWLALGQQSLKIVRGDH